MDINGQIAETTALVITNLLTKSNTIKIQSVTFIEMVCTDIKTVNGSTISCYPTRSLYMNKHNKITEAKKAKIHKHDFTDVEEI